MNIQPLQQAMDRAAREKIFPGGVLFVGQGDQPAAVIPAGRLTYGPDARPVDTDTVYDLASLTKPLATAVLTMMVLERTWLNLETTLDQLLPLFVPADKKDITLRHLLSHTSGLPAWRPLHEETTGLRAEKVREEMMKRILAEPLESPPGQKHVYSDLDFMLLGFILERYGQDRQDRMFTGLVSRPLGLTHLGYRPLGQPGLADVENIAPTEDLGAQGGLVHGRVHDSNAAALGGVAGHAGLFGRASDVYSLLVSLRASYKNAEGYRLVASRTLKTFWRTPNPDPSAVAALGFDRPAASASAAGNRMSRSSLGHLGFTGTSFWYDPDRDATVILLTNRVHPSATSDAIQGFRPMIHDLVMDALADTEPRAA